MIIRKNTQKSNSNFALRLGKLMLILGIMLMLSVGAFAQVGEGTELGDPDAPFDGGISLLVAAGVAYGAKQWRNGRKSNEEKESDLNLKDK